MRPASVYGKPPGMARRERSAGFLIFHRRGKQPADVRFLLLNYGRHWDFPKGHVNAGESDMDAAVRELAEETGIRHIRVIPGFHRDISYYFRTRQHGLVHKTVIFFLAEIEKPEVILSEEHIGFDFLPFDNAVKRATYAAAKELLRAAQSHLLEQFPVTATS